MRDGGTMIQEFTIKEFRCFRDFTIKPLERINLIVGKNNVGKTALLEALWLYSGYFNPGLTLSIENFRGVEKLKSNELLWDLFHGFDPSKVVKLFSTDERGHPSRLEIEVIERIRSAFTLDKPSSKRRKTSPTIRTVSPEFARMGESEIVFKYFDRGSIKQSRVYVDEDKLKVDQAEGVRRTESVFMPSRRRESNEEIAERLSKLLRARQADQILRTLQILEDRLRGLSILYVAGAPVIHATIEGEGQLVPLPLMGDGIGRLLSIALSITYARGGNVFIDEIENGLHFSAMSHVGQAIADLASECNVQVFATSHSEECISAVREGIVKSQISEKSGRLFRLERKGEDIVAISYTLDELGIAEKHGIEVR
jgi:AAA15 family ATPase/GTPase